MEIFEQDTELARLNTGTVTPEARVSDGWWGQEPSTHFFIMVLSVLSKLNGPVAGTESVSEDNASRCVGAWVSEMWVSVRRSWSTPSRSKYPIVTREPAPRPGILCGAEGDGVSMTWALSAAAGKESTLGSLFSTLCRSDMGRWTRAWALGERTLGTCSQVINLGPGVYNALCSIPASNHQSE
jgi:hypothetical protein